MNALALFLALVLQGNPTCISDGPVTVSLNNQSYAAQTFQCYWGESESVPSHTFDVWSSMCDTHVGHPVLVKERHSRKGWALNEFGEFFPATMDVDLKQVYRPSCG
jgi:hypothetical protein